MRRSLSFALAAATLVAAPFALRAEPLPKATVDYAVDGTVTSGKGSNPATIRHSNGRMRVDTETDGHAASVYIDMPGRKATMVTQRLGQKIAVQVDPDRAGEAANFLERDAKVVGKADVAGETCTDFEFENAKGRALRTCITSDGIPLRTRDISRDRVVWEASRVVRAPQASALFTVPADAIPVSIPKLK
jgi:hypothetical protein